MKTKPTRHTSKAAKKQLVASLSAVRPSAAIEERAEALAEVARKARRAPFLSKYRNRTDPEETAYLLRNPTGAARLMESVEQLRAGQGKARDLLDGDDLLFAQCRGHC